MKSFKDQSRIDWHNEARQKSASIEDIQTGALQRIADATEAMAKNHQQIINERDRYKEWYENTKIREDLANRRIAALQGVITKLKKKLK